MEKRYQFRQVNELSGLLVLGVLALVLGGIILSAHSQRWFARKYAFNVLLPEAGALGLRPGADVVVLGVSVGFVDEINVGDDGRMTARVKIRHDFARFVRMDSTASVKKIFGVAGDSFMEITRGAGAALPASHAEIVCVVTEDSLDRMEKMLADMHSEVMPVVKKAADGFDEWEKLGVDLRYDSQQWHQFVARLDNVATGLEQGKGTAGELLTDTTLADGLHDLLNRTGEALGQFRDTETNLNLAVKNIQNGTARLPEVTDAMAREAKDLPGLVQQTQMSMRELERLIEAMQRNWLVRKYINKTNPPPEVGSPGQQTRNWK